MVKTTIDSKIREYLEAYKLLLVDDGVNPDKLYLFGSYAKGKQKVHSDIDVAVVSSDLSEDDIEEYVRLSMISNKIDDRIEPHSFTPAEFASDLNPLAREVKRTGIEI